MELPYLVSCGYTGLLATSLKQFVVIYSDFRAKDEESQERKVINLDPYPNCDHPALMNRQFRVRLNEAYLRSYLC